MQFGPKNQLVNDMVKERYAQDKNAKPLGMNFTAAQSFYTDEQDEPDPSDLPELVVSVGTPEPSELDELDASEWSWDPAEVDDDGTQLINDNGRELLPDPEREVSEDEALEIENLATSYRNT